jgi:putative transposase
MNNHYHILLSPIEDDVTKISLFMKKVNMGYAKFFNEKYKRSGYLWEGKYKKIHIQQDSHFNYIPYYIHLNPLDMLYKEWRQGQVTKPDECMKVLDTYRWSSFFDYNNQRNFPSVITKNLLGQILLTQEQQTKTIKQIIKDPTFNNTSSNLE